METTADCRHHHLQSTTTYAESFVEGEVADEETGLRFPGYYDGSNPDYCIVRVICEWAQRSAAHCVCTCLVSLPAGLSCARAPCASALFVIGRGRRRCLRPARACSPPRRGARLVASAGGLRLPSAAACWRAALAHALQPPTPA